jgi:hypothetical protein
MGSRQRIPYRERILEYCQRHRILVPRNFDAPRSSEKFVVVDESTSPSVLLPKSTYLKKEVIAILTDPANAGRKLRSIVSVPRSGGSVSGWRTLTPNNRLQRPGEEIKCQHPFVVAGPLNRDVRRHGTPQRLDCARRTRLGVHHGDNCRIAPGIWGGAHNWFTVVR